MNVCNNSLHGGLNDGKFRYNYNNSRHNIMLIIYRNLNTVDFRSLATRYSCSIKNPITYVGIYNDVFKNVELRVKNTKPYLPKWCILNMVQIVPIQIFVYII